MTTKTTIHRVRSQLCIRSITYDLTLYAKAQQLQMKYLKKFCDRKGGWGGWVFHIALNFLSLLGKYGQSGLEDLLIESAVYADGTTSVLMLGKSYNRSICAHKLTMKALFPLLWKALPDWLSR